MKPGETAMPAGVDALAGGDAGQIADRGDAVAADRDVSDKGRSAGAVIDRPVGDDDIVALGALGCGTRSERKRGESGE